MAPYRLALTIGWMNQQVVWSSGRMEGIYSGTAPLLKEEAGMPIRELRVDGGASANDFLMQFQADILDVRVDRPAMIETTAMGAAFLAGMAVGVWKDARELEKARRVGKVFSPARSLAEREKLYQGWKAAVARVRTRA